MLWIQAIAQGHECLRDTPTDTTSTSFLLNAVLSLKCGVRERRHLQHHAKTADHVISVDAPSLSMCKIKAFGCSCEKQKKLQKKIRGSIYYLRYLYNIYIFLKGPKFFKDYNCWFNTSPFLQFCEGEATFATLLRLNDGIVECQATPWATRKIWKKIKCSGWNPEALMISCAKQ